MHSEGRWGLERGLVGWWRLMGSNQGVQDLIGTNDGTLNGGMGYSTDGERGFADFDGVDDYVNVPYYAELPQATDFTLAAWISTTQANTRLIFNGSDGVRDILTLMVSGGKAYLHYYIPSPVADYYASGATSINTGSWVHVAGTRSGSTFKVFVGGSDDTSTSANGSSTQTSSDPLTIGDLTYIPTNAYINDVRIYNRALSAAEIARLARIY